MTRRLFPENDAWSDEACRAGNELSVALMDILAVLEQEGPVDLKDFHFLASQAVGTFVAGVSIDRRIGDPASPPRSIIRAYPRFSDKNRMPLEDRTVKLLPALEVGNG